MSVDDPSASSGNIAIFSGSGYLHLAGKWYWEPKSGKRVKLTLEEAVDKGMWCWYDDAGTVCMARPGGGAFDRKVIARCEALDD